MADAGARWRTACYASIVVLGTGLGVCAYLLWDARSRPHAQTGTEAPAPPEGVYLEKAVQDRLAEADERLDGAEQSLRECEAARASLRSERDEIAKKLAAAEREAREEQAQRQRVEGDLRKARGDLQQAQQDLAAERIEWPKKLARELAALGKTLTLRENENLELQAAIGKLRTDYGRVQQRATNAEGLTGILQDELEKLKGETHFFLRNRAGPMFLEWALVVARKPSGGFQLVKWSFDENGEGWTLGNGDSKDLGRGVFAVAYIRETRTSAKAYAFASEWNGVESTTHMDLERHLW